MATDGIWMEPAMVTGAGRDFYHVARRTIVPEDPRGRTVWELIGAVLPMDMWAITSGLVAEPFRAKGLRYHHGQPIASRRLAASYAQLYEHAASLDVRFGDGRVCNLWGIAEQTMPTEAGRLEALVMGLASDRERGWDAGIR